ncbi:hypothetical protein Ocin01_08090 [Orchesella cincta]|uniref:Uncharacterized protein n=1 Tax=Orchesella cincta TaxID=48709 RepID=A0A1D2MZV3_ORCCI|nr:hypothetical protein Ocin01_08090 [Orchesella cincta]
MCTRLSFICLVVSCLSITFVLSAPSQKRLESSDNDAQSKIKHLVQSQKTVDAFDEKWYEVDDDHEENENKPVPIKAQSTTSKSAAKKDFKTICEEKDASGKCRTAQSGEKQPDHLHGLEQLISSKHQLTEKEAAHVLEMITSMSNKLHECQKAENKPCADTHGKQIAEIEEKHTKERKYIKKKEHDDTKTAVKDSMNQNANDGSAGQSVEPNGGGITQASTKAPNPGPAEPNYLEGPPSNVNYNGGINSPMDKLIQKYPEGHWPEKGNEADVGNDIGSENATEAGKGETATTVQEEYYEDEDDFKVMNMSPDIPNTIGQTS